MPDQPNFIIFMSDQHRGDALSIERHPAVLTPIIDSFGGNGTHFSKCYSTCPSCIPARRAFLRGQSPQANGVVGFQDGHDWDPNLSLIETLRKSGYQTAIVGRAMHQPRPDDQLGFEYVSEDYKTFIKEKAPDTSGGAWSHGISSNGWSARSWHLDDHLHYTHWVVNEAQKFLNNRDESRPFVLIVSWVAPHPPIVPPQFYFDRYLRTDFPPPVIGDWAEPPPNDGIGMDVQSTWVNLKGEAMKSCLAGYYGLINHIDDQIYRVVGGGHDAPLDWSTRANTTFMYTTDHGEMLGDHYLFRKCYPFEGSARIPLLIQPAANFDFKRGQSRDEVVCLEDVLPTVLDMAGIDIPSHVDGKSLVPILRGDDQPDWRNVIHGEHATCYRKEQANHYLTDGRDKYVWMSHTGHEYLFDLSRDPQERRNLAADPLHRERTDRWRRQLITRIKDRPEGFTDGEKLIAGQTHTSKLPGLD